MKRIICVSLLLIVLFVSSNCNKTKFRSNRIDENKWEVTELSVDGQNITPLPTLKFNDCKIYKENCNGWWYLGEGHAEIAWQFREKGKLFELSNQADHVHGIEDVRAAEQCIQFSGVYDVVKSKRNSFEIKTNNAFGYKGKTVSIKMKKI